MLREFLKRIAPTHGAEKYVPCHDGTLNMVEARRGRGKSFGSVRIALLWLKEVLPGILAGTRKYSKIYTNNSFNHTRLAYQIMKWGLDINFENLLKLLKKIIVYITSWKEVLTAYDSLILMDEANRNINLYDNDKAAQTLMLTVHDWLQQTRKHKLTLWFFVQYLDWVKPQLRMLMDRLWRARRVLDKKTKIPKYFPWYGSDPFANGVGSEVVRRADFKMVFDFDINVARIYNSWQAIDTLQKETPFQTFAEISDYMYAHDMKPLPTKELPPVMTYLELKEFMDNWQEAAAA